MPANCLMDMGRTRQQEDAGEAGKPQQPDIDIHKAVINSCSNQVRLVLTSYTQDKSRNDERGRRDDETKMMRNDQEAPRVRTAVSNCTTRSKMRNVN